MNCAGINIARLQDKQYVSVETERAEIILKALEQSEIPYFAKYDDTKIILAFDNAYQNRIDEILMKADCTDEEEIVMFKSNPDSMVYTRELLPEIADLLNVSVSMLESKPKDIQTLLVQTYVNYWHSDSETIKKALNHEIRISDMLEQTKEKSIIRDKEELQRVTEMERLR
jgi:hypothetical protein